MAPTTGTASTTDERALTGERAALLAVLTKQRFFLRFTARDLTHEQAAAHPTASELCIGGLIKHVAAVERTWADFILGGAATQKNFADMTEDDFRQRAEEFQLQPEETLEQVLAAYEEVAARTDAMIAEVDLDATWPLPEAPWFQDGEWSVRQVLLHIIAETAQHSGHADIIRESIDGAKTMG